MRQLTQEWSRVNASIVIKALSAHQIARHMNEFTQEKSRRHASIVKSALTNYQVARNMSELTQERSHIHASIHTANIKASHIRSVHMNKLLLWFNCRTVRGSCRYGTIGVCGEVRFPHPLTRLTLWPLSDSQIHSQSYCGVTMDAVWNSLLFLSLSLKHLPEASIHITHNTFRHCRLRFCWTTFLETAVLFPSNLSVPW